MRLTVGNPARHPADLSPTHRTLHYTEERMNIKEHILSAFKKECPHCGVLIDVTSLPKVRRRVKLRWYQFTPAPHLACPECGGFVIFTLGNSLLLVIPTSLLLGSVIASMFLPHVKAALESIPGFPHSVGLPMLPIAWYALRRATLLKDAPEN
jgi:hypothetical protein